MSNTELDTERDRNIKELVEYLANYIDHRRNPRTLSLEKDTSGARCAADWYDTDTIKEWIAEGIEAFESIHDVKVCVMSEVWRYSDGKG